MKRATLRVRRSARRGESKPELDLEGALRRTGQSWQQKLGKRFGAVPWSSLSTFAQGILLLAALGLQGT
jgi:hypothetical protein